MQEKNNQNTIKILIGIIIGLSVFILLGGIFYILNMQSKIADLEQKQEEQLKQQSSSNKTNLHKNKKNITSTQKQQQNLNEREIEKAIDDTINQIDNNRKEEDKLTRNIESVMGE